MACKKKLRVWLFSCKKLIYCRLQSRWAVELWQMFAAVDEKYVGMAFAVEEELIPNRSLDRYCGICYRKYNFLPSFIFLLASCCSFVLDVARYAFELTINHLLNNLMKSVQDLMTDLGWNERASGENALNIYTAIYPPREKISQKSDEKSFVHPGIVNYALRNLCVMLFWNAFPSKAGGAMKARKVRKVRGGSNATRSQFKWGSNAIETPFKCSG